MLQEIYKFTSHTMDVQAYWEKPGLFGKDFFLSKKIKTNQFLGFKKKKKQINSSIITTSMVQILNCIVLYIY